MPDRISHITQPELQIQETQLKELFGTEKPIIILDIGACEGESSIRYSLIFPKSQIFTIEPLPNNFVWIEKNIQQFNCQNIHPFELCLSDQNGEADFFVSSSEKKAASAKDLDFGNKSSSLLPPGKTLEVYDWLEFKEKVKVKTQTLTSFCEENHLTTIDFIHLDVQGAELMVLSGADALLWKDIKSIWLEVEVVPLYQNQPLKKEVEIFMKQKGFVKIIDNTNHISGDQFWVNKNFYVQEKGKETYHKIQREIKRIETRNELMIFVKRITRKLKLGEKWKKLTGKK